MLFGAVQVCVILQNRKYTGWKFLEALLLCAAVSAACSPRRNSLLSRENSRPYAASSLLPIRSNIILCPGWPDNIKQSDKWGSFACCDFGTSIIIALLISPWQKKLKFGWIYIACLTGWLICLLVLESFHLIVCKGTSPRSCPITLARFTSFSNWDSRQLVTMSSHTLEKKVSSLVLSFRVYNLCFITITAVSCWPGAPFRPPVSRHNLLFGCLMIFPTRRTKSALCLYSSFGHVAGIAVTLARFNIDWDLESFVPKGNQLSLRGAQEQECQNNREPVPLIWL